MLQACSCASPAPDDDKWINVNKLGYIGLHINSLGVNKKGDDCECQGKESEINKSPWCYLIGGHLLQDSSSASTATGKINSDKLSKFWAVKNPLVYIVFVKFYLLSLPTPPCPPYIKIQTEYPRTSCSCQELWKFIYLLKH